MQHCVLAYGYFWTFYEPLLVFPGGSDGKSVCLQGGRPGFYPWVGKVPWRRKWQPSSVLFPGKSNGWKSLVGYHPWGLKESDTTEWLHFHFSLSCIGEEMATHSSVLAWRSPGTGEPGGLPSMGSHRVGHDWATSLWTSHLHLFLSTKEHVTLLAPSLSTCYVRQPQAKNMRRTGDISSDKSHIKTLRRTLISPSSVSHEAVTIRVSAWV